MADNLTDSFLHSLSSIEVKDYPKARECLLDYFGVVLAGKKAYYAKIASFLTDLGTAASGSTVICGGKKVETAVAALINAICAHAVELDDGHRIGMPHLEAPIISALLAVSEKESVTAAEFLKGVVVGYEATIRLACSIQPDHKLKGYHATGTCGTVGVAMGIAAALHFDFEQMKSAFSAAVTSSAGLLEMIEGDSELKPYNAGRAAMDGLVAAYIGKSRFKAPIDALGGRRGFLKVMTGEPRLEYLNDFSGGKFMIDGIYVKPYAACRHCHPSMEAAMRIRSEPGFDIDIVDSIHVDTYRLAVAGHDHTNVSGVNSAKMSIPYSLAVALYTGRGGLDEFTEKYLSNPRIKELTKIVTVSENDALTALCPSKRAAIVTIKTSSGFFTERVDYPKGEPENPLSRQELEDKFRSLAMYSGLTSAECDVVINEVWKKEFDLKKIIELISR